MRVIDSSPTLYGVDDNIGDINSVSPAALEDAVRMLLLSRIRGDGEGTFHDIDLCAHIKLMEEKKTKSLVKEGTCKKKFFFLLK